MTKNIATTTYTTTECAGCGRTARDGRHLIDGSALCPVRHPLFCERAAEVGDCPMGHDYTTGEPVHKSKRGHADALAWAAQDDALVLADRILELDRRHSVTASPSMKATALRVIKRSN